MRLQDGSILEGTVDLAFQDEDIDRWIVVDYKTDIELKGNVQRYRNQVGLYALSISHATVQGAKAVLLRI